MVSLSHLKKHFEELEASMTPEERAEQDRKHQKALAELAKQQERMWAPYRRMEEMLAPYRALEEALAPVRLAEELRRLAEPSPVQAALPELTRIDELERYLAGPSSVAAVTAELSRARDTESSLAQAFGESASGAIFAELARVTALETSPGLSTHDLLAEHSWGTMLAELEAVRLQEHLFQEALNPRSLLDETFRRLAEPSLESMMTDGLGLTDSYRDQLSPDPLPLLDPDEGVEVVDGDEPSAETAPKTRSTNAPGRLSLKERRMAAYQVLREDVRLAAAEGGPEFDEMLGRVHELLVAMEREVEDGLY